MVNDTMSALTIAENRTPLSRYNAWKEHISKRKNAVASAGSAKPDSTALSQIHGSRSDLQTIQSKHANFDFFDGIPEDVIGNIADHLAIAGDNNVIFFSATNKRFQKNEVLKSFGLSSAIVHKLIKSDDHPPLNDQGQLIFSTRDQAFLHNAFIKLEKLSPHFQRIPLQKFIILANFAPTTLRTMYHEKSLDCISNLSDEDKSSPLKVLIGSTRYHDNRKRFVFFLKLFNESIDPSVPHKRALYSALAYAVSSLSGREAQIGYGIMKEAIAKLPESDQFRPNCQLVRSLPFLHQQLSKAELQFHHKNLVANNTNSERSVILVNSLLRVDGSLAEASRKDLLSAVDRHMLNVSDPTVIFAHFRARAAYIQGLPEGERNAAYRKSFALAQSVVPSGEWKNNPLWDYNTTLQLLPALSACPDTAETRTSWHDISQRIMMPYRLDKDETDAPFSRMCETRGMETMQNAMKAFCANWQDFGRDCDYFDE